MLVVVEQVQLVPMLHQFLQEQVELVVVELVEFLAPLTLAVAVAVVQESHQFQMVALVAQESSFSAGHK
jgi:hypothetical protein